MINKTKHECSWDTVVWEKDYHIAGLGETLERRGQCIPCGKKYREVYLHSCIIDDETNQEASLS